MWRAAPAYGRSARNKNHRIGSTGAMFCATAGEHPPGQRLKLVCQINLPSPAQGINSTSQFRLTILVRGQTVETNDGRVKFFATATQPMLPTKALPAAWRLPITQHAKTPTKIAKILPVRRPGPNHNWIYPGIR